jgi:GGDEF domain-containing protein
MFQQRRQATLGNINLGNLSAPPTFEDMSFLLEQAHRYRGRFVEVSWVGAHPGVVFQLTAKIVPNQALPVWMLYRGVAGNSQLVWGHNSNDLTLMNNLVLLENEKPADGGDNNNISAGAMDNLVTSNRSAGSIAGGATDGASNAKPGDPKATWLNNLNYGQKPEDSGSMAATATASGALPIAAAAPAPAVEAPVDLSIDGSLSNITVANLYRYLINNRLTGRLAIQSSSGAGELFLSNGVIQHAATLESKGDSAVYDCATWTDGQFQFHADEQTAQLSVSSDGKTLLEGSQRIIEYFRALIQGGLHPASYLVRKQDFNRTQFEQGVRSGLPIDVHSQYRVYDAVQGNQTFTEVLRTCPMVRAEWIPIVYNLLNCGVLGLSDGPASARPGMYLEGEPLDTSAIVNFISSVSEADGLLNPGAFLYFLQQEYSRHERTGTRFALVLFSFGKTNILDGKEHPLDLASAAEANRRMLQTKRKLDVIGHFDANNCAILLPETDTAGAAVFAHRLIHLMNKPPLTAEMQGQALLFSFGIASVPDDARDVETLVAATRVAKNKSKMMGAPVVLYGS